MVSEVVDYEENYLIHVLLSRGSKNISKYLDMSERDIEVNNRWCKFDFKSCGISNELMLDIHM